MNKEFLCYKLRNLNANAIVIKRILKNRNYQGKSKKKIINKFKNKEEIKLYLKIKMNQRQLNKKMK
jgi:hypothetical protein